MYQIETVVCYSTFLLFLWWAIHKWRKDKWIPTNVYLLVAFLFLGQGYASSWAWYTRATRVTRVAADWAHVIPLTGIWWDTRICPRLIIEILIFWRMCRRVYINFWQSEQRRRGDKDGDDV